MLKYYQGFYHKTGIGSIAPNHTGEYKQAQVSAFVKSFSDHDKQKTDQKTTDDILNKCCSDQKRIFNQQWKKLIGAVAKQCSKKSSCGNQRNLFDISNSSHFYDALMN